MRQGTQIPFVEEVREERAPPTPKVETRKSSLIPLIDEPVLEKLVGSRLPIGKEVFSHFFYLHKIEKMVLRKAKRAAVKAAASFWERVSITPKGLKNGVRMLSRLHEQYQANTYII